MIVEVVIGSAAVVTVAALRFARWVIEYEDEPTTEPKIYRWVHPRGDEARFCPICGSGVHTSPYKEYRQGVTEVPSACPWRCRVKAPHLHAHCYSCKSDFLTATRGAA